MPHIQQIRNLPLRYKLMGAYLGLSVFLFTCGGMGALYLTKRAIQSNIESALRHSTRSIINMAATAAQGAIKNYLRAVAERNLEIAHLIHRRYLAGQISQSEAQQEIRRILLSQTIGKTGYIYCVDSQGIATVHPRQSVEGNNWSHFDFVQRQMALKTGYIEYQWQNPGEALVRPKALYMAYFAPFDWIISVSSYRDEFSQLLPMDEIRRSVKSLNFGSTGYAFILDQDGNMLVHPELEDQNILKISSEAISVLNTMRTEPFGQIIYRWRNPADSQEREKLTVFGHVPELQWIVGSSGYLDEIYAPIHNARNIMVLFIAAAVVLSVILTGAVSNSITRRLGHLMQMIDKGRQGDLTTVRAVIDANDEIGRLGFIFNEFVEKLQSYHRQLAAEVEQHRSTAHSLTQAHDFNNLILSIVDALVLVLDNALNVVSFNRACETCSGYTAADIQGQSLLDALIPPEEKNHLQAVLGALTSRKQIQRTRGHWVTRGNRRRLIQWSFAITSHADDVAEMIVCAGIDITEQAATETALQKSEALFEAVFNQTFQLIGILAADGTVRGANQTALDFAGIREAQLVGKKFWDSTFWNHSDAMRAEVRKAVERASRGEFCRMEVTHQRHDGEIRTFDFSIKPVRDEAGQIFMLIPEGRDITAQKLMEAQLLQSKKMDAIGTLAGGIAHDFNNNLQAIAGYTQLLLMDGFGSQRQKEMLATIQHACDHGRELTRQLLTFSRKIESRLVPLDLNAEIRPVVTLLQRTLPRMVDIQTVLADDLCIVEADRTQFEQIIMNLGINAGHAMPDGGRLTIETKTVNLNEEFCRAHLGAVPGTYAWVSVVDTGCGMDTEIRAHIFEPFFTTRETGAGTGLGLAMVYGIVKSHRGYITCDSAPGRGTTFNVYLPAAKQAVLAAADPVEEPDVAGGSESVLIVDDDPNLRELGRELLERHGYQVQEASDGHAALSAFRRHGSDLDLIILDLNMPGMGGLRCLQEIRALNSSIPVLIASGYAPDGKEKRILESLAQGYVSKPYRLKTLLRVVRQTLDDA